jgi:putative redox protein
VSTIPRRLEHATLHFSIDGDGIERVHAERAIDLAVTKYCSVRDSLRPDVPVEWTLTLNGSAADVVSARAASDDVHA